MDTLQFIEADETASGEAPGACSDCDSPPPQRGGVLFRNWKTCPEFAGPFPSGIPAEGA